MECFTILSYFFYVTLCDFIVYLYMKSKKKKDFSPVTTLKVINPI